MQSQRETRVRPRPRKLCATCGRSFEWRKAWEPVWDEVRYCSASCRRHRPGPSDRKLERDIVGLLERRANGSSICPSEVARTGSEDDWRALMEPVRRAARRLAADGVVEITQRGRPVDPTAAAGPIRIRLISR